MPPHPRLTQSNLGLEGGDRASLKRNQPARVSRGLVEARFGQRRSQPNSGYFRLAALAISGNVGPASEFTFVFFRATQRPMTGFWAVTISSSAPAPSAGTNPSVAAGTLIEP